MLGLLPKHATECRGCMECRTEARFDEGEPEPCTYDDVSAHKRPLAWGMGRSLKHESLMAPGHAPMVSLSLLALLSVAHVVDAVMKGEGIVHDGG
jgi:hypothetical protein